MDYPQDGLELQKATKSSVGFLKIPEWEKHSTFVSCKIK